ncbi:MAG: 2-amino-4-hydroxy-6-hydroxymethyldihydropteridine diphosphokinase [Pseudomonadota bacterium]
MTEPSIWSTDTFDTGSATKLTSSGWTNRTTTDAAEETLPEAVTAILHDVERRLGRERGPSRFTSRTIDLDLLLYGNLVRHDAELRIPRPEIAEYACVLRPLAELAPEAPHPRTRETFAALWARFDQTAQPLTLVGLELPG